MESTYGLVEFLAQTFLVVIGVGLLIVVVLYVIDVTQTSNAVRRNFPVIGRFRALFEHLGEFFRQYFFAMDREEMPFNRAERTWVYRAAEGGITNVAFGSTRDLKPTGTVLFVNCPYPTLERESEVCSTVTVGPYCEQPYQTDHFFHISAMSFGSLSRPAVRALAKGAAKAGCWINTGEGGLSPYHLEGGGDVVFQLGTAKYGVQNQNGELDDDRLRTMAANPQVKMFEIKLSQGAKPGKGGILPAIKVNEEVSRIRLIPEGEASISPNRHPDIDSVSDLIDMVERIRRVTGKPTGFKAVLGAYGWLDELVEEIHKRGIESAPDFITLDSADGGTGAAPMSLIDYMGLPLRESLPLVVNKLREAGLRERVKVIASGKLTTPGEVAWALCAGADFINSARGFMFSIGCIQALQCNRNTCPTGVTTHDKDLQKGLVVEDKLERVARYQQAIEKEVGVIAHSCGVREPRKLRRFHCRVVQPNGLSTPLDELYGSL